MEIKWTEYFNFMYKGLSNRTIKAQAIKLIIKMLS